MRILDRYIVFSILKTTFFALLLLTTMILLFNTFSNLDRYLSAELEISKILLISYYYIPQAILYALAPSLLFSTTYFLAMIHANNEMIILSNSGYPFNRIVKPIIVVGIIISIALFFFSEMVALDASVEHKRLNESYLGTYWDGDNHNVTLQSFDNSYVIHVGYYWDDMKLIGDVLIIFSDEKGEAVEKIVAKSGTYENSVWHFKDVEIYSIDFESLNVSVETQESLIDPRIDISSTYFKNLSGDIDTMKLDDAYTYLQNVKIVNANQYQILAVEFFDRLLANINPLLLMIISCATIFGWKKNVLVLSILLSLVIAVIYYVLNMVSIIFAKQGLYDPIWGSLIPIVVMFVVAQIFNLVRRI